MPRHYHSISAGRDVIALDAASVDDAITDATGGDRSATVLTTVCYDEACLAGLDADTLPAEALRRVSRAAWCPTCHARAEYVDARPVLIHAPGCDDPRPDDELPSEA